MGLSLRSFEKLGQCGFHHFILRSVVSFEGSEQGQLHPVPKILRNGCIDLYIGRAGILRGGAAFGFEFPAFLDDGALAFVLGVSEGAAVDLPQEGIQFVLFLGFHGFLRVRE